MDWVLPQILNREHGPVNTLNPDFCPAELCENKLSHPGWGTWSQQAWETLASGNTEVYIIIKMCVQMFLKPLTACLTGFFPSMK